MMRKALATFVAVAVLSAAAQAAGRPKPRVREKGVDFYQKGLSLYSQGRLPEALAAFKLGLRARPRDAALEMAALRVERELAAGSAAPEDRAGAGAPGAFGPSWSERLDEFLIGDARRFLQFDLLLGDRIAQVGTLEALRGRVAQLLIERRIALARRRHFRKERELRALVRRMPVVVVV